jgi:hypothetical protein
MHECLVRAEQLTSVLGVCGRRSDSVSCIMSIRLPESSSLLLAALRLAQAVLASLRPLLTRTSSCGWSASCIAHEHF